MFKENPCTVCGKSTPKLLFDDNKLRIPICSYECEHKYLDSLSKKEETRLVNRFENRIARTKHLLRSCWATAGVGILVILTGFLTKTASIFIVGASLVTICAFLTRYFEGRILELAQTRKRIAV